VDSDYLFGDCSQRAVSRFGWEGARQIDGIREGLFAARAALWLHRLSGGRDRGAHQSQVTEFSKVFVKSAGKLRDI